MAIVLILALLGGGYIFLTGVTWLVQFIITATSGEQTQFWVVFAFVLAFVAIYNVATYKAVNV